MPHAAQFTGTFYTEAQMRDLLTAVKNERLYPSSTSPRCTACAAARYWA